MGQMKNTKIGKTCQFRRDHSNQLILAQFNGHQLLAFENVYGDATRNPIALQFKLVYKNCNVRRKEYFLINLQKVIKIFAGLV